MATNPTLLTTPIAENGQKNTIPATQAAAGDGLLSQSTGFPPETALPLGAGGKAPTREDFNGAFNLLSDIAFYSQKGWTFQYDANQTYFKGCIVMDATDGKRYECINDVEAGEILPSADQDNDYWREYSPGGVPLGTILIQSADAPEPPYGFLYAEGQAVSRTMYADYFALVGTKYGSGNGSTTFNLPNPLGKYPQFAQTAGTVKSAGLPSITGNITPAIPINAAVTSFTRVTMHDADGALGTNPPSVAGTAVSAPIPLSGQSSAGITFDASRSNPIYGNSDTVTPPTITFRAIVKVYDAPTPSSAQIDLSQYASDLAARLTREQTPAFNKRDVITTSGTYTAPVTGWYKIEAKGGGCGGFPALSGQSYYFSGYGGGEGGITIGWEHLSAGDTVNIVVGAGGSGVSTGEPGVGGDTTVTANNNSYVGGGAKSHVGGAGTIPGAPGGTGATRPAGNIFHGTGGGNGGGNGGGIGSGANGTSGGGGGGGWVPASGTLTASGNGGDGYATFEYFDPSLM